MLILFLTHLDDDEHIRLNNILHLTLLSLTLLPFRTRSLAEESAFSLDDPKSCQAPKSLQFPATHTFAERNKLCIFSGLPLLT